MQPYTIHIELEVTTEAMNEREAVSLVEEELPELLFDEGYDKVTIVDASARPYRDDDSPSSEIEELPPVNTLE